MGVGVGSCTQPPVTFIRPETEYANLYQRLKKKTVGEMWLIEAFFLKSNLISSYKL